MSKISRAEYLKNIRNIINEGMSDNPGEYSGSNRFNISRYIAALVEEGQREPGLMDFLIQWQNAVNDPASEVPEFMLYRQFANSLTKFSKGNLAVKKVLNDIQATLDAHAQELDIFCAIELINDPIAKDAVRDAYNEYLLEPSDLAHQDVIEALMPAYEANDNAAYRVMNLFSDSALADTRIHYMANESVDEYARINKKLAQNRVEKKTKKVLERLEEYANTLFEAAREQREHEREMYSLAGVANNNGLNLAEAIKSIASSDASKNKKLMETIEQYAGAIRSGLYEERLYETLLNNLTPFEYLKPVKNAVKKINEAAAKNQTAITITKLLEEMSESSSYQLLPLVEEACARYAKEPSPNNRVAARQCLVQFAHDPYCYALLEAIDNDNSKAGNTLSEQVMTLKDTAKLIREKASTSTLYSPVQYIKEGECVFNANGTYFVKKNNNISKLDTDLVNQLSEKFVTLCKLVNDPAVQILENKIILHGSDKIAEIYEGYADINKNRESRESLRNLQEMCMKYDFDTNFFIMCSCLLENFNNIAKINFGTHIALNADPGVNVDMFRLGDNIFINTVNENTMQSTFFHNVNPLQCKNIINGHMGINVAAMFENLLPDQSKILMRLHETQEEYMNSINKLESTIDKLEAGKKKCNDKTSIAKLDDNIKKAKEQLEEVKDEYKKWQDKVGEETGEDIADDEDEVNGDGNTRTETTSEPLDDKEVEANIDDLSSPITADGEPTTEEADEPDADDPFTISDDEFEQFIGDEEETEGEPEAEADVTADEEPDLTAEIDDLIDSELAGDDEPVGDESPILDVTGETDDDAAIDDELGTDAAADDVAFVDDENAVDGGFDELPVEDDAIVDEPAAEEVASDEDVILPETDADLTMDDEAEPEATDMFGGDTEDPIGMNGSDQLELTAEEKDAVTSHSDIAAVMFDENIKTGEKYRSGYVSVITPMVTGTGDLYNDMKNYKFYIDNEGNPVIDGDAMSAALYNGIIAKIKSEPLYDVFVREGKDKLDTDAVADVPAGGTKVLTVPSDNTIDFDDDIDDMLKTTDTPDEFSVELDFDDDFNTVDVPADGTVGEAPVADGEMDFNTVDDVPFIPTYKSGDTEIELPAPGVDGTAIPESKKTAKKASVNEARKAIKGIKPVINRPKNTRFFVNEGTGKSSDMKRRGSNDLNEDFAGAADFDVTGKFNDINATAPTASQLESIHKYAQTFAAQSARVTGHRIQVTPMEAYLNDEESLTYGNAYYFIIRNNDTPADRGTVVYAVNNMVFARPYDEFEGILNDLDGELPLQVQCALEAGYMDNVKLDPINMGTVDDWQFAIRATISHIAGESLSDLELNERCKIRKVKLSSGGDYLNSKHSDDILHGEEEERDFKEEVEKDTQAAGVENPLAPAQPAQEEAYEPVLPNVHRVRELMENYNLVFETNDRVIYKNYAAEVISVSEDEKTASIKFNDGTTKDVDMSALEPDPEYVNDLNIKDSNGNPIKDEVPGKDLDAHTIDCDIVVDGHKINIGECWANIMDIKDSKTKIRVLNEEGYVDEYDIVDNLKFNDWPFAVIIDGNGEPIRKIQIDPQSYVTAEPDDLVNCLAAGKQTQFPKRVINILT